MCVGGNGVFWEMGGTLGEGIGTSWLRPFQKVKNP